VFWGDVQRDFMQRLFAILHGIFWGSYLRVALHEGSVGWHTFMFLGLTFFPVFLLFAWWSPLLLLVRLFRVYALDVLR
jgi:hypothetical protein